MAHVMFGEKQLGGGVSIAARHFKTRSISYVAAFLIAAVVTIYILVISVLEGIKDHYMEAIQGIQAQAQSDQSIFFAACAAPHARRQAIPRSGSLLHVQEFPA
jgi:ABC-type lipoprotein release transport system permease subunit